MYCGPPSVDLEAPFLRHFTLPELVRFREDSARSFLTGVFLVGVHGRVPALRVRSSRGPDLQPG